MVSLDDILSEVLKNPETRAAYEEEKKVLAEEIAEWETQQKQARDPAVLNIEAR
jgi:GrpB-like predicted nucleotidyltransferase (UPF0157 family)